MYSYRTKIILVSRIKGFAKLTPLPRLCEFRGIEPSAIISKETHVNDESAKN